jgi:hypothetical protein
MTRCEELQFDLPLYFDGSLKAEERSAIDAHLPECPLCRQKLSEFEDLSFGLRSVPTFSAPVDLVESIRASVAAKLSTTSAAGTPTFQLIDRRRGWTEIWLMPSTVGTLATVVITLSLLYFTLSSNPVQLTAYEPRAIDSNTTMLVPPVDGEITGTEYARSRMAIAGESPSINPRGALVALTKSLVRGEMRDDEVTVVADVFSNGLAQVAEVVEPSHDRRAIEELQKALQSDPSFAPFVPADVDKRSGTVRVVLKIQNVNVRTHTANP